MIAKGDPSTRSNIVRLGAGVVDSRFATPHLIGKLIGTLDSPASVTAVT